MKGINNEQQQSPTQQETPGVSSFLQMLGEQGAKQLVSPANIAGALFKIIKPDKKIIHRSMGGVIYEDTEDHLKKKKKKQEVS